MEADPAPAPDQGARPTGYTAELGALICERLMNGERLTAICREDGMPHRVTVFRWLTKHPEFAAAYREARLIAWEVMAEDLLDIADDGTNDWTTDGRGNPMLDHEHVQRSRLRVDTRKWVLAKVLPRRWGEKPADPEAPPVPGSSADAPLHVAAVATVTVEQREAALRAIGAREAARRQREAVEGPPAGNA